MKAAIRISVDGSLDHLLGGLLREHVGDVAEVVPGPPESAGRGDVSVVSERKWPPEAVAALVGRGLRVVVLASLPTPARRRAYQGAGASGYLPMDTDVAPLAATLRTLVTET